MLPSEIMKYRPANRTDWFLIPQEYSEINEENYSDYATLLWQTWENHLGWFTIEEHIRLSRVEPVLFQCCLTVGIKINDPSVVVYPAKSVRWFSETCFNADEVPLDTNHWGDIGYRVQRMLRSAALKKGGVLLDYD